MSNDDPFSEEPDPDATVIRPSPGPRSRQTEATQSQPAPQPQPAAPASGAPLAENLLEAGNNPLITAATSLFGIMKQLRNTASHPDIAGLRDRVVRAMQNFEKRARALDCDADTVFTARYCLCTAVDEVVLNTPWGSGSLWANQSLLNTFHNERWGGEKFFVILKQLQQQPGKHLFILELMYVCIALGFQGQFRIMEQGGAKLERLAQGMYQTIRMQRGEFESELSPHWRGEQITGENRGWLLVWLSGLSALVLLLAIFLGFSWSLSADSDVKYAEVQGIGRNVALAFNREPPPLPQTGWWIEFEGFLEEEIRRGILEVIQGADEVVIRVFNKGLFGSGQANVPEDYQRLFEKIGRAIEEQVPGPVTVIGHSDNTPIRTARFPSNYELSLARARAVAEWISPALAEPGRLTFDGRSDTEPVASNDSAEGRARNRRVEITLRKIVPLVRVVPRQ